MRTKWCSYEIIVEDVTQQRKLEDHLRQEAAKDPLTGLANYRWKPLTLRSSVPSARRVSSLSYSLTWTG